MADQVVSDVVCEIHPRKVRCTRGIEISKVCSIAFVGGIKDIGDHFGLTGTDILVNRMGRHRFLQVLNCLMIDCFFLGEGFIMGANQFGQLIKYTWTGDRLYDFV